MKRVKSMVLFAAAIVFVAALGMVTASLAQEVVIDAIVNISPQTLNLKSKGKFINCTIALPEGYDVADIDPDSIIISDIGGNTVNIPAVRTSLGEDGEGNPVMVVKFSRPEVLAEIIALELTGKVEIVVTGALLDSTLFIGSDTVRILSKKPPK